MEHKEAIHKIQQCAEIAHQQIHELYQRDPNNETFEQACLLDGRDIVIDSISHGEWVIALEHLLYMIHESDIRFDMEQVVLLHQIAKEFDIENYYKRSNFNNQVTQVYAFNIPEE